MTTENLEVRSPVHFKVTGTLRDGKRFKAIHTSNQMYAMGINLYRGNVWFGNDVIGWRKIKSVYN
jgi:hypothetical protein